MANAVTLMTLCMRPKGLEFPGSLYDRNGRDIFPHSRAFDVSCLDGGGAPTCAMSYDASPRQELYMLYASSRMLYVGVQHNPPSRFFI